MNNVNVGVQVPATSENATSSSTQSSTGANGNQAQIAGEGGKVISTVMPKVALVSPKADAGLAIFAIIFIIIAIILLVLVFRDKLIKMLKR